MIESYSVSRLIRYLRELLEGDLQLTNLWVEGEISNLSRPSSGHLYFTLKDASAQLRCVMFRQHAFGIMPVENGQQVLAHGAVSLYEARGELQLSVDFVRPAGLGVQQAQFEHLKTKLEAEGLFTESRKRPLPPFPHRIGVVTSEAGAALQDILRVLSRRWPLAKVVLASSPVQGADAVPGIVAAIGALNDLDAADVIILARGGGSAEELATFNEELIARAIYGSRIPIVTGIGHETDDTIADFVADVRAPTPSAAAERSVPDATDMRRRLHYLSQTLETWTTGRLNQYRNRTEQEARVLARALPDIGRLRETVSALSRALMGDADRSISGRQQRLTAFYRQLTSLDPKGILQRGYAIAQRRGSRTVVSSVQEAHPGQQLDIFVRDGHFPAEVAKQHGF